MHTHLPEAYAVFFRGKRSLEVDPALAVIGAAGLVWFAIVVSNFMCGPSPPARETHEHES